MRNISIRMPEGFLLWIDEQIEKVGQFGSRADVFREALMQFMNPTIKLDYSRVVGAQIMDDALIETVTNHPTFLLSAGDSFSCDLGTQLVVLNLIEPRKLLLKFYSGNVAKTKKAFLVAKRKEQEWQDVE